MLKKLLLLISILLLATTSPSVAASDTAPPPLTQRDLIVSLIDSLGWSFGLPDRPEIKDYITILNGRRVWRFEIESIIIPDATAPLAPKETLSFGAFSGKTWHRAPGRKIEPEISFLLPISGQYEFKASITKPDHKISINNVELTADGEHNFSVVSFGSTTLSAGIQSARMTIPSRGGIDYLLLEAPPVPAIEPFTGWSADKKLTNSDLAVVITRVLGLSSLLPPVGNEISFEAEEAPTPEGSVCCEDQYKGPMQGQWLKTGIRGADYSHLFEIEREGVYDLYLNVLGKGPVYGLLNGRDHFTINPRAYFTTIYAGSFYFEKEANQLDILLPSRAGLDRFVLKPRLSSHESYLRLTGLPVGTELSIDQLDQVMRLIAAIGVNR